MLSLPIDLPAGIVQLDVLDTDPAPLLKTRVGELADLAREFILFTPGLLHTYGSLQVDPVGEFVAQHPDSACHVSRRDFDRILFRGIARNAAEEAWDRRLYFVERRFWDALRMHLTGVTLFDRMHGIYAEARLNIVPMAVGRDRERVFVTSIGFSGNYGHIQLHPSWDGIPFAHNRPLEPHVVALANRVFQKGAEALQGPT